MRRAASRLTLVPLLACLAGLLGGCDGCARKSGTSAAGGLTFEKLPDTSGLSQGVPLLTQFDVRRGNGGVLFVSGKADLPEGTRLRVAIKRPGQDFATAMSEMVVHDRRFESPPMVGDSGPLPLAIWRFEVVAHFSPTAQPAAVLNATDEGRSLRGPGITRSRLGGAEFYLAEELKR